MDQTWLKKTDGWRSTAIGLIPLVPLRIACRRFILATAQRHPDVFTRMGPYARSRFLINPVDLPVCFSFHAGDGGPSLRPVRSPSPDFYDAIISGRLSALWQLARARDDGDALFFSRDITISGDTEAVLALRNAMDDMDADMMDEILESLGPLQRPARRALRLAGHLHRLGRTGLDAARDFLAAPPAQENAVPGHRPGAPEKAPKSPTKRSGYEFPPA